MRQILNHAIIIQGNQICHRKSIIEDIKREKVQISLLGEERNHNFVEIIQIYNRVRWIVGKIKYQTIWLMVFLQFMSKRNQVYYLFNLKNLELRQGLIAITDSLVNFGSQGVDLKSLVEF